MKAVVLLGLLLIGTISCDNYAVLVAGSYTYSNYRHQSDVFHHYHILIERGIKPENIILFAYDDIANNSRNPFPGQIFNKPDGKDVYAGVKIDYYGNDVTPANFIAAITGDEESISKTDERTTGRFLKSTENDNVYIFFSDHGSDNLICFPKKNLYKDELIAALKLMNEKKMYKELVFYLESCHSGSMFNEVLPDDIHVYTTTAANPSESSYAEYCSSEAKVNGTLIKSCLGDEYSCRFMEDIDSRPGKQLKDYTMQEQYEYLVGAVKGSHVQQYGDLEIAKKSIYEFVNAPDALKKVGKKLLGAIRKVLPPRYFDDEGHIRMNNEDQYLLYFKEYAETTNSQEAEDEYYEEVTAEARSYNIFQYFKAKFNLPVRDYKAKVDFNCYRQVVQAYDDKCGYFIDRDFKYMTHIANFCTLNIDPKLAEKAFKNVCYKQ